jgi:chromosome segregation ATPase
MLITLGFLLAALSAVVILPAYRRRIERFATESVKRALPLTEDEIRADRDRLRAEFAMDVHKLETKLEDANIAAARQSVEVNRRDARVHELEQAIAAQQLSVEEHENARRVLEQAILDRLPKVEQRLSDARKLLAERDADIALLADTSSKQTSALEEATQINLQQSEELHRLRAALDTRAARHRETMGDPRFDGEVALRTEIEMLRSKSREQSALISRLQSSAMAASSGDGDDYEIKRLRADASKAEAELLELRAAEGGGAAQRTKLEARVRELESERQDQLSELAKLRSAVQTYEAGVGDDAGGLSSKAEINALQAEVDQQRLTIQSLRADVASSNERLARQAQHFRDELRRLGSGASAAEELARKNDREPPRIPLAERLTAPRPPRPPESPAQREAAEAPRPAAYLKAVNGNTEIEDVDDPAKASAATSGERTEQAAPPRKPRLLERLGGYNKPS